MKFAEWIVERNQRDAAKMPKRRTALELQQLAASKNIHGMKHGRAGSMETSRNKGSRASRDRKSIERSSRGE